MNPGPSRELWDEPTELGTGLQVATNLTELDAGTPDARNAGASNVVGRFPDDTAKSTKFGVVAAATHNFP